MTKQEKAQDLAEKLARKAASAEKIGNTEEAMAFAAKAFELADKYGFDTPDGSHEEDNYVTFPFKAVKYYQMQFCCRVAELYGVAPLMSHYKRVGTDNAYVHLHGKQESIDLVVTMFNFSAPVLEDIMKIHLTEYREQRYDYVQKVMTLGFTKEEAVEEAKSIFVRDKRYRQDFFTGVGVGLQDRVEEARNKYAIGLVEVMSLSSEQAMMDYTSKHRVKSTKSSIGSSSAFSSGIQAADAVSQGDRIGSIKLLD